MLTSWNPLGHSRPVTGLLYLYLYIIIIIIIIIIITKFEMFRVFLSVWPNNAVYVWKVTASMIREWMNEWGDIVEWFLQGKTEFHVV